ncbi:MAG: MlaD family protein [Candidatus Caenarcaniphilales bacterium]|nr:MlaD family protein [Candidatus Caenarcaniphilales bacterium]
MAIIIEFLKGVLKKLVTLAVVASLAFWGWNTYKNKRESRTFIVSFNDVEGLTKGSPIYANGIKVGKVIQILPLGNTNSVGVKGLITSKDFPNPGSSVRARIINNIESGGGKILDVVAMNVDTKQALGKGENPYILKHTLRITRDFFQMSKDFSNDVYHLVSSKESESNKEKIENAVQNTVTSIEYGTVQNDIKNQMHHLNKEIKELEKNPNKKRKAEKEMENQAKALKNTLSSFGSLADVYREE